MFNITVFPLLLSSRRWMLYGLLSKPHFVIVASCHLYLFRATHLYRESHKENWQRIIWVFS